MKTLPTYVNPYLFAGLTSENLLRYRMENNLSEIALQFIPNHRIVDLCVETTLEIWEIDYDKLIKQSRFRELILAKFFAISMIRKYTTLQLTQIGRMFGRNHATIIAAVKRYNESYRNDPEFRNRLIPAERELERRLENYRAMQKSA